MLPLAPALVFLAVLGWRLQENRGKSWRLSILEAATILAAAVIAVSELLSLGNLLKPGWIALGWTIAAALSVAIIWRTWSRESLAKSRIQRKSKRLHSRAKRPQLEWIAIYGVIIATGIIAWVSPPTNFDSMTYQFPRVMHWLQQGSTDHYPTTNARQLSYGPGTVYWQLHLWSLWDGDRAACLVQWLASVGAALGLSVWVRRLVPAGAVGLALLVGLTLPMSVLQASSSQTDLQITAWLLAGMTLLCANGTLSRQRFMWAGFAFGIAVLTKPVAVLVGIPMALGAFWMKRHSLKPRGSIFGVTMVVVAGLLICAPQINRELKTFGTPLGSSGGTLMESRSPLDVVSNASRWLMLNVPSMAAWRQTADGLEQLGVDVNDPTTTFKDLPFSPAFPQVIRRLLLPDEDFVSYTASWLFILAITIACCRKRRGDLPSLKVWGIAIAIAAISYPIMIKWQIWGNRLLLPLAWLIFPLWMARTGVIHVPFIRRLAIILLIAQTLFVLTFSLNRPWVNLPDSWRFAGNTQPAYTHSRNERFYLSYNQEAASKAQRLANLAKTNNWKSIGLRVDKNYPEYVLWRALHQLGLDHVQIHHTQSVPGNGLVPKQLEFHDYVLSEAAPLAP